MRRGPERAEIRPVREYGPRRSVELVGRCAYPGGFVGYLGEPSQVAAGGRPLAVRRRLVGPVDFPRAAVL